MLSTPTIAGWPLPCHGTTARQNTTAASTAWRSRRTRRLLERRTTRITRAICGETTGEARTCRRIPLTCSFAGTDAPATTHEPERLPADRRSELVAGGRDRRGSVQPAVAVLVLLARSAR